MTTAKRDPRNAAGRPDGDAGLGTQGFDATVFLASPQRAAEAWIAASQTLLKGAQDVSNRGLMLQATLMEQSLSGAARLLQPGQSGPKPEDAVASVQKATETTLQSMRDIVMTACKCSMDALETYRSHMAADGSGASTGGPAERPPVTGE